jgi:hypothetical protein
LSTPRQQVLSKRGVFCVLSTPRQQVLSKRVLIRARRASKCSQNAPASALSSQSLAGAAGWI